MPPTVVVLLREPLDEQQRKHLSALFQALARNVTQSVQGFEMRQDLGSWHLWGFHLHALIGVTAEEGQRLTPGMGVHLAVGQMRDLYALDQEASQYLEELGYVPQQGIVCDATNGTPIHHRLLGNVAYALASRLQGLISFTYPALPPAHPERFTKQIQSLPVPSTHSFPVGPSPHGNQTQGQVFEIYLDLEYIDPQRYYTVVDAQYFHQMLTQPQLWLGQ